MRHAGGGGGGGGCCCAGYILVSWSAYNKSPSTAFNYDVIANTDDGYFLRYTLYIKRGGGRGVPGARCLSTSGVKAVMAAARPCDCFRMYETILWIKIKTEGRVGGGGLEMAGEGMSIFYRLTALFA